MSISKGSPLHHLHVTLEKTTAHVPWYYLVDELMFLLDEKASSMRLPTYNLIELIITLVDGTQHLVQPRGEMISIHATGSS